VPADELAEKIGITSKTLLSWLGNTKKANEELVANFETYYSEEGKKCIRRKDD